MGAVVDQRGAGVQLLEVGEEGRVEAGEEFPTPDNPAFVMFLD